MAFSAVGILWLLLLCGPDDPIPPAPSLALTVNGVQLASPMAAFMAQPGSRVSVSCPDSLSWSILGFQGHGRDFTFTLPRSHGIFTLTGRGGNAVQEWAVIVPVDSRRMRTTTLNSFPMGFYGGVTAVTREQLPERFVEIRQNSYHTRLSTHLAVSDMLQTVTGDWPQYMALELDIILKLEMLLDEVRIHYPPARSINIISGFRTPALNASIGNETSTSLHLYGKAADFWIESWPSNNLMDDIDRNKRIDVYDGEFLVELTRSLEARGVVSVGGASAYRWTESHGPYVHIDTRGTPARWQTRRNLVSAPVI